MTNPGQRESDQRYRNQLETEKEKKSKRRPSPSLDAEPSMTYLGNEGKQLVYERERGGASCPITRSLS